jgi:Mg/Co/Ni transporter MgtE
MTEKIVRRGVKTPDSFEPDLLEKFRVKQATKLTVPVLDITNTVGEIKEWIEEETQKTPDYFIVSEASGEFKGIVSISQVMDSRNRNEQTLNELVRLKNSSVSSESTLKFAAELMSKENSEAIAVISEEDHHVIGVLSFKDILAMYKKGSEAFENKQQHISLKHKSRKLLLKSRILRLGRNSGKTRKN